MLTLLQVNFPFRGPFAEQMTQAMQQLALSISREPGLLWKLWTENAEQREAGGIYLFETQGQAQRYVEMHVQRLTSIGVKSIEIKFFAVNQLLSQLTHAGHLSFLTK